MENTHDRTNKFRIAKVRLKKQDTSFYGAVQAYFDILNRFGVTHNDYDGRTDILIANATLH